MTTAMIWCNADTFKMKMIADVDFNSDASFYFLLLTIMMMRMMMMMMIHNRDNPSSNEGVKNCCEGVGWWRLQWLQHNWSNVCELVARSEVIPAIECEGLQESKCTVQQYQFSIFCMFFLKAYKIHPVEHGKLNEQWFTLVQNVNNSKFALTLSLEW